MMNEDLNALEGWAGALLAKLTPSQRKVLNRSIAQDLRRSQSQRIASQRQPDGSPFAPRKASKDLRGKKGRIKRKRQKMFSKIRTAKYLKIETSENHLDVGYFGGVARIARVHQFGEYDRVRKDGPKYKYAARVLLGLNEIDRDMIGHALLQRLAL